MDILLRPAQAFEEYFFSQVDSLSGQKSPADAVAAGAAKPGLEVLVKHCFAPLNTAEEQVIHPDLIPGNILVSGDIVKIIDFEKLSIGFPEFALGKLLTKADVSASLEGRLVKYAAEKRAELERKTLGEEELAASAQRYELNRIAQELFTAVRYLKRSAIASSGTLRKMADASYSLALRRIESAEKEGLIGHDFRQALENYLSASGIKFTDLGSDAARYLVPEYAVHAQASQENVALAGRINLLSGGNAAEEAKAELGEIRRGLRRSRVRGYLKKAAYAALPLLVIAGSGSGLYVSEQRARAQQQKAEALSKQSTLSGRLAILAKAGHDVGSDDLDVLAKKQLDYTSKVFKDPKTAAAFYLSPEITYAAIKDIGSTKYADLKEYLEKNHPDFYFATTYDIEGAYLVDNFARTEQESMTRQNFERLWSEAGTAYSARRGGPVSR
jgi:hypothetical protein